MTNACTQRPVSVYMIGNAHIDPVWLWTVDEGRKEVLNTYRTAIMLLRDYHGYVFTSGGATTYQWVQQDDPALFAEIRCAVDEGRWVIVNGWMIQPDCNVPNGESFARHALYGQRYFEREFGVRARVGYNVDSFGHAGTLPQILKLSGLDYYVFFRPGPHEKTLPRGPFWWEAPDGTRVLTCRPPLHYGSPGDGKIVQRMEAAAADTPEELSVTMCFYGVGNHGGGPTRSDIELLMARQHTDEPVQPVFTSPERYFDEMLALGRDWPVLHDDLQHHARGCYTAISQMKSGIRAGEHALMRAERLAALAVALTDGGNHQAELQGAWEKLLFNQFHDILAGTSIRKAYDTVWADLASASATAAAVENGALAALQARVAVPECEGQALVVWNTLPWQRTDSIEVRATLPANQRNMQADPGGLRSAGGQHGSLSVGRPVLRDANGVSIPAQLLEVEFEDDEYQARVAAQVVMPALGARAFTLSFEGDDLPPQAAGTVHADRIENAYYTVQLDPATGYIRSLRDNIERFEHLAGPAGVPLVIDDYSDTWSHDIASFRNVVGQFTACGPAELVADGLVSKTLRVRMAWGQSTLTQEITLWGYRRAVDVVLTVDWHEQHKMLKLAFPLAITDPVVTASAPYGWITRKPNGEEEPCQAWVDLSGKTDKGIAGLCLVQDSKYGYDALDNELRLSVLRSPIYAFHDPRKVLKGVTYHYTDQGTQVVRYRLLPHVGDWRGVAPDRQGYALMEPFVMRAAVAQPGIGKEQTLLTVEPSNVLLSTIKLAEEQGAKRLLVRGYETDGKAARVVLRSEALGQSWEHAVRAHEIFTLALPLGGGAPQALNLLEEPFCGAH